MQNAVQNLQPSEFKLELGDTVQLQFHLDDICPRHYVKVIGHHNDQSIMVSTPHINGKLILVHDKQLVTVRILSGRYIVAFKTWVLKSRTEPFPYLHLAYPNETQSINVRRAQRVSIKSRVKVTPTPTGDDAGILKLTRDVCLEDLSTSGALVSSDCSLGAVGDILKLSMDLSLQISSFDKMQQQLNLVAIIRNIRNGANGYLYGVEFRFANREEAVFLHAYVNENLIKSS